MKIKTFILTFLIMSCSFLFGQHWVDPDLGTDNTMPISATITLDDVLQTETYQVAAFHGNTLLEVQTIIAFQKPNNGGILYHVDMDIPYVAEKTQGIYFKLFNGTNEYVSSNKINEWNENGYLHTSPLEIKFKSVAQIEGTEFDVVYPTIKEAIAAAQVGETVTILKGNYTQNLDINKAITVQGEDKNLVNITGKLNITADGATAKNLNVNNGGSSAGYINAKNVIVDGCTVVGGNGFRNCYTTGTVTFKNSTITGSTYGIHFDGSAGGEIVIDNCVITGWTSFASTITKVTMKGTSFKEGNYNYVRFYQNEVVIEDCIFNEKMAIDIAVSGNTTTINNCTFTNGNIEDLFNGSDIVNSKIIVNGDKLKREASIGNTYYKTLAEAYTAATDGQIITLLDNITLSEKFVIAKSITLDGKGKTLTYTGNGTSARAIDVPVADGVKLEVTIKNLTVDCTSSYCQRGINYNEDGKLTLEAVTVKGTNVTYALNLPGSSDNCEVAINNSSLTGNIALNVWGENTTINAKNSNFTSVDKAEHENYSAIAFNNDGTTHCGGTVVRIDGGSIIAKDENDEPSRAVRNSANVDFKHSVNNETTIVGTIDIPVAVVTYNGYSEFYSFSTLQSAINKAANDANATVKLISNIELSELVKVEGKVVIDLNGKTVKANCKKAFEVYADATIKNGAIEAAQRCVDTRKAVKLTLTNVELVATSTTYGNSQVLTVGGSENGTEVTMENVEINAGTSGYGIITFVETKLTAKESAISGYSALYVKPGSDNSEFNFVKSDLSGGNIGNDVEGNSFSTIAVRANNVAVNVDAESTVAANGNHYYAISFIGTSENTTTGSSVTVAGEITANNFLDGSTNGNANTIKVKAEYAGKLLAEGYVTSEADANGLVQVSGLAVAKIGETYYKTLAEALEAVKGMSGEVTINLLSDATLDITAWQELAIGGDNTTSITIDGENGVEDFTLTFNKLNSDWNHVATNNNATLVLKNMTITDSGYNNGPWNRYDLNFACNTELVNVNATKALAFKAGATLNNVAINETGDNYAIWIQPNGQNVAIDGLVINSAGRGIKVDEQYVTAQNVNLSVANATFTTAKKAAIMVKSAANTAITVGENVNISGVSDDQTNIAWVDEDAAAHYGKVTVTGGALGQENMPSFVAALMNGDKVEGYYETLPKAITAQTGSEIVKVLKDATGAGAKINKDITIDFNDKTYTFNEGVGSGDLTSNGFQLLQGNTVVLKNGGLNVAETAKAKFYILVQNYANLTVEDMNLDGTNLDKWSTSTDPNDGDSYVLSNNSGTVNIIGETNITANDESSANPSKAFAFDVYDKKSSGYEYPTVNVETTGKIDGRIEVSSTIPNNLNISGGTFTVEIEEAWCANGFIPKDNGDGTWTVKVGQYVARIGETGYEGLDDAFAAAQDSDEVKILVAGTYALNTSGKNITITGAVDGVVFDNIGAKNMGGANVTFNNVTFNYATNSTYKGLQHSGNLTYNDCTINGQVFLYGESETFNNCKFITTDSNNYNVWTYGAKKVAFNECTFNSAGKSVLIYAEGASIFNNVNVTKCTFNASAPVEGKAAIEMNSEFTAGINLKIDAATTATGFGSGNVSGNSLWNNKNSNETEANNDITVVVNNETVLAPLPLVAAAGGTNYTSLQAAYNAVAADGTITILDDVTGPGLVIDKNVTIDFNEKTYTFNEGVGSGALTSNGFQILQGNTVVLKNGELNVNAEDADEFYILVQNYTDLTVENMTLDGTNLDKWSKVQDNWDSYTLSNNSGEVNIIGSTIIANNDGDKAFAFDVDNNANYTSKPVVYVQNLTDGQGNVTRETLIKGNVEVDLPNNLNISGGTFTVEVEEAWCVNGFIPVKNADNTWTVREGVWRAQIGDVKYETVSEAVKAAVDGNVIELLVDVTENFTVGYEATDIKKITIDLKQHTLSSSDLTITINRTGTELTLVNGTVTGNSTGGTIRPTGGGKLILGNDVIVKSGGQAKAIYLHNGSFIVEKDKNVEVYGGIGFLDADNNNSNNEPTVNYISIASGYYQGAIEINEESTCILTGGTYTQDVNEWCADGYVSQKNGDGTSWTVVKANVALYHDKELVKQFASLHAAIDVAQANDVIVLLNNITEDVTVGKSLTIDGKPAEDAENVKYTGNISVSGSTTKATVKNVNFVNGTGYAITTNRINTITVENCTVTNYGFGFLYANKSTPTVVVKNVEVKNGNYGFHWSNGTTATLEDVKMTDVTYGLYIQNNASKTINLKNCNITNIAIWEKDGMSGVQTFNFEGTNTVGTLSASQYAKYQLVPASSTLAAPADFDVTTSAGYVVKYEDGKYVVKGAIAKIDDEFYASLQEAINAAVDNDVIEVLKDINLADVELQTLDGSYNTYFKVEGKAVTIDLNGKKISGEYAITSPMLVGVFSTDNNGHLTLTGNGTVDVTAKTTVYSLVVCYEDGCTITIENGTYTLDKASDNLIYYGGKTDAAVTVKGGTFTLGNVNKGENGKPWIFNVLGAGDHHVYVTGGTFNFDINRQHWSNEAVVAETCYTVNNGDGTYTVKEGAEAYVNTGMTTGPYFAPKNIGYATLEEAIAAAVDSKDSPVTLLKDGVELEETVIINGKGQESLTIDFAGKVVTSSASPAFRIQNNANVIVKNGNIDTKAYNFILGDSNATSAGNLTIVSGKFHGTTSVVSVTKGHLNITGGEFSVEPYQGNYAYLINCIDANYNNETATVAISGGTFHNWNPENNAAEGTGTDFCAEGYGAVETAAGSNVWEVMPVQEQSLVEGWNWYSTYLDIKSTDLKSALGNNATVVKGQTQTDGYLSYDGEGFGWSGTLNLDFAKMYMINTTGACDIRVAAEVLNPNDHKVVLNGDWNWIGYPSNQSVEINTALTDIPNPQEGDVIKTRNSGHAEYAWGMWVGRLTSMIPGEGYMYRNTEVDVNGNPVVKEFYYTVETTSTTSRGTVEANYTAENNHWVPNVSEYPFNMTMTAVVDGLADGNYEVAAFVNGEVRGSARPIYVEPMDAYVLFLTINGEDVEEMSFRLYDIDNDTEYDLSDRINYSNNAHLGSVREPYVFSRGTTGIGEASMSEVNIYPNPTTTGTEINLEATCDKVEVFNALGVKVAEYQNVDSIDALETAGIYVIRITNNGNVQNCRLVVK